MAKRRTRKQKQSTKQYYQLPKSVGVAAKVAKSPQMKQAVFSETELYAYDPALIRQDLLKTIVVSAIILTLQLGLYFWLR